MNYFGYGANQDGAMMEAIVGRLPNGESARLDGYELVIQHSSEMSEQVREVFDIGGYWSSVEVESFRTYAIRRALGKQVTGTLWVITEEERAFVDEWEMNDGLWCQRGDDFAVKTESGLVVASTETMEIPSLITAEEFFKGKTPPVYLNTEARMHEVARQVRADFVRRQQS